MSGIYYTDKCTIYTPIGGEVGEPRRWYATELEHVRVELTQGSNIRTTGLADADICRIKVYDKDLTKPYETSPKWRQNEAREGTLTFDDQTIFIITEKADMGISVTAPTGVVEDAAYEGGLQEYLKMTYGLTFRITTADHYSLIPHWEIGGR